MVTETVGTMTAKVGSLPDGEEMAALTLQKALVVIEGPAAAVDNLVNSWTIGSSQPPTSSP
jgi:YbbR domain-containing protein